MLAHDRRRILHVNVTANPTAEWTAQQVVEALPWDHGKRYMIRDRAGSYGDVFRRRNRGLGIEEVLIAQRSPWQSPYVERVIGTLRRECFDHLIILNERHLLRILREYLGYYHRVRPHLSLEKDAPEHREVEPRWAGTIVSSPVLGGLHHKYCRRAAA